MIGRIFTISAISIFVLTSCSTSKTEIQAMRTGAIVDARNAPKELHLEYLNCYPLPRLEKNRCICKAATKTNITHDASSWDYIHPYNYEAEKLGFIAFIQDQGKKCDGLDQGVLFSEKEKSYIVNCIDGNRHLMKFDRENKQWSLIEGNK